MLEEPSTIFVFLHRANAALSEKAIINSPQRKSSCARSDLRVMLMDVETVTFSTSLFTNIDDMLMVAKGYLIQRAPKELQQLQRKS